MNHNHQHAHVHAGEVDPVCGMTVDPAEAAGSSRIGDRTFYFCSTSCKQKFNADPAAYGAAAPASADVTDPVCGMTISKADAAGSSEYGGATYYFCNPSCKEKFDADPAAYTGGKPKPAPPGATYICPMDP